MALLKSHRGIFFFFMVLLVFGLLYLVGCKSVHAELVVHTTPEKVWSVLIDTKGYKEWNPVLIPVEGELKEGEKLKYQMRDKSGTQSEVTAKVIKIIPNKILNQYDGIPGILTFNHTWKIEPENAGTKVIQHEEYRGIGVLFWDPSWFQTAYQKSLERLRERIADLENKNK
jgi:hypothetical protein